MHNPSSNDASHLKQFITEGENDEINLGELLSVVINGKWLILIITLILFLLGLGKASLDTPIYKVDAMLQVKEKSQSIVGIELLADMFSSKLPIMAEIEILKSRKVLGAMINDLDLEIIAKPKFLPFLGEEIARKFAQKKLDNEIFILTFGLTKYAWGGEEIKVDTLVVPDELRDKQFILLTGNQGQFQLYFDDELIAEGEVGKLISQQIGNYQQPINLFVSLLKAQPGTQFILVRQSSNNAISQIKKNLTVSEKGKNTGIIELTLESDNAADAVRILNKIADIYVQQNIELKSAESQKTLEFIEKQLPILKEQMVTSIAELNEYKNQKSSVNLDIETQNILAGVVQIKTQITLLQQNHDELRQKFTELHPDVITLDKKIARLHAQLQTHNQMIKALPKTQQIILELSSNVQVNTNLYNTLLDNAHTLRVTKEGTVGDVRIIDYAILPDKAIKPNKPLIAGAAFLLGMFLGFLVVFVRKSLFRGIDDPDLIEKELNIPVYANIYHSDNQDLLNEELRKAEKSIEYNRPTLLSMVQKKDIAIESLRSLRTTIQFSLLEARNNIIAFSGPSPGIGKSFVASNFTAVMADTGKKILLIDADLRKGNLDKLFGINRTNGLSELILNTCSVQDATRKILPTNFDFIPTGTIPPNPSELLMHKNFIQLLDKFKEQYDLVIIDTPPILAVTDAAIVAQLVGAVFMVVKDGSHTKRELKQSIKKFSQAGAQIKGIIFNDISKPSSTYGYRYSYGKYIYQYSYQKTK